MKQKNVFLYGRGNNIFTEITGKDPGVFGISKATKKVGFDGLGEFELNFVQSRFVNTKELKNDFKESDVIVYCFDLEKTEQYRADLTEFKENSYETKHQKMLMFRIPDSQDSFEKDKVEADFHGFEGETFILTDDKSNNQQMLNSAFKIIVLKSLIAHVKSDCQIAEANSDSTAFEEIKQNIVKGMNYFEANKPVTNDEMILQKQFEQAKDTFNSNVKKNSNIKVPLIPGEKAIINFNKLENKKETKNNIWHQRIKAMKLDNHKSKKIVTNDNSKQGFKTKKAIPMWAKSKKPLENSLSNSLEKWIDTASQKGDMRELQKIKAVITDKLRLFDEKVPHSRTEKTANQVYKNAVNYFNNKLNDENIDEIDKIDLKASKFVKKTL